MAGGGLHVPVKDTEDIVHQVLYLIHTHVIENLDCLGIYKSKVISNYATILPSSL